MDILQKINHLKKEKNAIILAHYYQPDEIQAIADFVGDSLELSKIARDNDADTIVFCGVRFMAGSAKLLSPQKTVLIPVENAYCEMAAMLKAEDIQKLKEKHPNATVVTYINSTVEAKKFTDICCTSSNAVKVVNSVQSDEIIFLPDRNLGAYVQRFTDKKIILFEGYCPVHNDMTTTHLIEAKKNHPNALVLVHPECTGEVIDMADFCGSTSGIINFVAGTDSKEFIIGTEKGILYKLREIYPDRKFHIISENHCVCEDMKRISLEDMATALEKKQHEILFDNETIQKASKCLVKMLEL